MAVKGCTLKYLLNNADYKRFLLKIYKFVYDTKQTTTERFS